MKYAELIDHSTWNQHKSLLMLTDADRRLIGVLEPLGNQIHLEQLRTSKTSAQKPQARPP